MLKKLTPFLNLSIKGASLLSRFVLLFFMGKFLLVEDLGIYGILSITVTLAVMVIGVDFYRSSSREIVGATSDRQITILWNQLVFYGMMYLLFAPFLLILFYSGMIDFEFIGWFYAVLIAEHLSMELFRAFTVLKHPVFANVLLFLKSGFWSIILLFLWVVLEIELYTVKNIMFFWLIGNGMAVLAGMIHLFVQYRGSTVGKIDMKWIKKATSTSLLLLGSTLAYKVIEFSDRYMIDFMMTKKDVGYYTFFYQISGVIHMAIVTAVLLVLYPYLLEYADKKDWKKFFSIRKKMGIQTIGATVLFAILLIVLIKPILFYLGKEDFYNYLDAFYFLILANVILNLSYLYHYVLFSFKQDRLMLYITLFGAGLNIVLNYIFISSMGVKGAAIGSACSFFVIGLLKFIYARKVQRELVELK